MLEVLNVDTTVVDSVASELFGVDVDLDAYSKQTDADKEEFEEEATRDSERHLFEAAAKSGKINALMLERVLEVMQALDAEQEDIEVDAMLTVLMGLDAGDGDGMQHERNLPPFDNAPVPGANRESIVDVVASWKSSAGRGIDALAFKLEADGGLNAPLGGDRHINMSLVESAGCVTLVTWSNIATKEGRPVSIDEHGRAKFPVPAIVPKRRYDDGTKTQVILADIGVPVLKRTGLHRTKVPLNVIRLRDMWDIAVSINSIDAAGLTGVSSTLKPCALCNSEQDDIVACLSILCCVRVVCEATVRSGQTIKYCRL